MDLENGNLDCVVCLRYYSADRARIRYLVREESIRTGTIAARIKQSLCEMHRQIGYSARSQTVGEAGATLDTTGAEGTFPPQSPTLSDFGVRHRSHHEYNVKRLKRLRLRRKRSKRL